MHKFEYALLNTLHSINFRCQDYENIILCNDLQLSKVSKHFSTTFPRIYQRYVTHGM